MGGNQSSKDTYSFEREAFQEAKSKNETYTEKLGTWTQFQQKQRHSEKIALWTQIKDLLETAKKNEWGTGAVSAEYENLPSFDTLKGYVVSGGSIMDEIKSADPDASSTSFVKFGKAIKERRDPVEEAADTLGNYLLDDKFDSAFRNAEYHKQVTVAMVATRGLGRSRKGREFLSQMFKDHPEVMFRLLEPPDTTAPQNGEARLTQVTDHQDKLKKELPFLIYYLTPGVVRAYEELVKEDKATEAEELVKGFQLRTYALFVGEQHQNTLDYQAIRNDNAQDINTLADYVETATWSVGLAKGASDARYGYLQMKAGTPVRPGSARGGIILAFLGLTILNAVVSEHENLEISFQEGITIAKGTMDLIDWGRARQGLPKLGGQLLAKGVLSLIDLGIQVILAIDAAARGDESVAFGYSLGGLGAATVFAGAVAEYYGASLPAMLGGGPPGWIAAVIGGILSIAAIAIVLLTQNHPIETWLEWTTFGSSWYSGAFFDDADSIYFRFNTVVPLGSKRTDGDYQKPNYNRQISAIRSMTVPNGFEISELEQVQGSDVSYDSGELNDATTYWHARFEFTDCAIPPASLVRLIPIDHLAHEGGLTAEYRVGMVDEPHYIHQFPLNAYRHEGVHSELFPGRFYKVKGFGGSVTPTDEQQIHPQLSHTSSTASFPPTYPTFTQSTLQKAIEGLEAIEASPEGLNQLKSWHVDVYDETLENVLGIPEAKISYHDAIEAVVVDQKSMMMMKNTVVDKESVSPDDAVNRGVGGRVRERVEIGPVAPASLITLK